MSPPPLAALSTLRQRLLALLREQQRLVESLLAERGPMIRGSFVRQQRACGRAGCRCERGKPHDAALLSFSEEGRPRRVHVPRAQRARVEEAAGRYRKFRQGRARLVKLAGEILDALDALQRGLTETYPPPGERKQGGAPAGRKE
jgi:hypothetical protein